MTAAKKDLIHKKDQIKLIQTKDFGKMFIKSFNRDPKFIYLLRKYLLELLNKNYKQYRIIKDLFLS